MNDSWSSEPSRADALADDPTDVAPSRRTDRYEDPATPSDGRHERYPWIGLAFLLVGLIAGAVALGLIARDLDRPGVAQVEAARWWIVVGGGLAIAWSAPWFLRPRNRRRMAIVLAVCSAAVLAVAALSIGSLDS